MAEEWEVAVVREVPRRERALNTRSRFSSRTSIRVKLARSPSTEIEYAPSAKDVVARMEPSLLAQAVRVVV